MSPHEHRARTIVLARALESSDVNGSLVSAAARQQALRSGLQAAPLKADDGVLADIDRLHAHAQSLVQAVVVRFPALGVLVRVRPFWRWLSAGVPLSALVAGMATDRIANPHRVDLLSAPLLVVLVWNVFMYVLLLVAAFKQKASGKSTAKTSLIATLQDWATAHRRQPPGAAAKVAVNFYSQWHRLTDALTLYRGKKVLHLAAAAWGTGIALSLAGRGLFVQYQVGWESTFLGASQVHAILEFLFWLPGKVFGLSQFTLQDVAVLRDFAVPSPAADRWVFLYAGLLALIVVLPRLGLAAFAAWRERRLSSAVCIDLDEPYYRKLLVSLRPAHLVVGLAGSDPRTDAQLLRLLRQVADDPLAQYLSLSTAEGDTLRWVEEPVSNDAVDAVLRAHVGLQGHVPLQWLGQPVALLSAESTARRWDQGPLLIGALTAQLRPALHAGLGRLAAEWTSRHTACFGQSMVAVSAFLLDAAKRLEVAAPEEAMAAARDELFLKLKALHRLDRATGDELEQRAVQRYAVPTVIAKTKARSGSTAAAAGAATGATMGGAIDMATGFLSLGAGVALGGLLGAGIAWAASAWRQKGMSGEVMTRLAEATLLLYFEVANAVRLQVSADNAGTAWQNEIARELARQSATLGPLWLKAHDANSQAAATQALAAVLSTTAQAALQAVFPSPPSTPSTGASAGTGVFKNNPQQRPST